MMKEIIKLAQKYLIHKKYLKGTADGIWGAKSRKAANDYNGIKTNVSYDTKPPSPDHKSLVEFFGNPGDESNLVSFKAPFPMVLSWDPDSKITNIRCHNKIAKPLCDALCEIKRLYSYSEIKNMGLHLYAGCYNMRKKRGGNSYSLHSWGAAIDLNPDENGNKTPWNSKKVGSPGYATMPEKIIKIFEKHGFKSGGRKWGRDAMHFEFTC